MKKGGERDGGALSLSTVCVGLLVLFSLYIYNTSSLSI